VGRRGVAVDRQHRGLLPIDFSEVTITRTLFRNGDSEYQINGAPCRLLDIQELLSDSGIGRQQHVIVSQGQLDTVLNARPEERRGVVEEAAGILKYRKRREKAERRLESTDGTLLRLNDLLREVRRGLGPLSRQADAARRHDGLAAELGAARLYLAGPRASAGLQTRGDRLRDRRAVLQRQEVSCGAGGPLTMTPMPAPGRRARLRPRRRHELSDALARAEALRERAAACRRWCPRRTGARARPGGRRRRGAWWRPRADAVTLRGELAELGGPEAELARESDDLDAERRRLAAEEAALVAAAPAAASPGVAGTPDSAPDAVPGGGPGRPAGGPAERDDRPPSAPTKPAASSMRAGRRSRGPSPTPSASGPAWSGPARRSRASARSRSPGGAAPPRPTRGRSGRRPTGPPPTGRCPRPPPTSTPPTDGVATPTPTPTAGRPGPRPSPRHSTRPEATPEPRPSRASRASPVRWSTTCG